MTLLRCPVLVLALHDGHERRQQTPGRDGGGGERQPAAVGLEGRRAQCASVRYPVSRWGYGPRYCPCHRCSVRSPGEWYPGGTAYSMGGRRLLVFRCRQNKSLKCLKKLIS